MKKYISLVYKAQSLLNDSKVINSKLSNYAIHSGHTAFEHPRTGYPVVPPISLSTTFSRKFPNCPIKYDYSRPGNYNREILEKTIAALEDAKYCCTYSSGLATLSSITQILKAGDHVLFFKNVFRGTNQYFTEVASNFNIKCDPLDMQNIDLFRKSIRPNTRMVWIETPSNPLMRIVDIQTISKIAKDFNNEIIVAVDNTFLTPVFQLPLNLGADIVMHSLTKYMNGHSDVLMGAASMNNEKLYKSLKQQQLMVGAVPSPFDCYLALRGLRTLVLRMAQHQLSGLAVALFLADHPKIEKVLHPALFPSPEKEIIAKQMTGFSGMLSAYIKGSPKDIVTSMQNLKYFQIAKSFGGYESLIEIPALMNLAHVPLDELAKLEISENLVRISVGLEDIYSLLEDLDNGLAKIN